MQHLSIFYRHISFLSDLKCILPVSFLKVCITKFMFVSGIGSKCSRYIHSHSAKRIVPPHSYSCNYKKLFQFVVTRWQRKKIETNYLLFFLDNINSDAKKNVHYHEQDLLEFFAAGHKEYTWVYFFFPIKIYSACGRTHVLIPTDIRSAIYDRGAVWCGEDDLVRSYSFMTRYPWMT